MTKQQRAARSNDLQRAKNHIFTCDCHIEEYDSEIAKCLTEIYTQLTSLQDQIMHLTTSD